MTAKKATTGDRLIKSANDALAYVRGEEVPGVRVRVADDVDTKRIRAKLALGQEEFCKKFGLELSALREWEQGRRAPRGTARVLIRLIDTKPEVVAAVVTGRSAGPRAETRKPVTAKVKTPATKGYASAFAKAAAKKVGKKSVKVIKVAVRPTKGKMAAKSASRRKHA